MSNTQRATAAEAIAGAEAAGDHTPLGSVVDTPFPRIAEKSEDDSGAFGGSRLSSSRARRTCSVEGDFRQAATIPSKAGRSKSRGRRAAAAAVGSSSSDATVAELQQRLDVMAREKVTLENAIEQSQEREFNQGRRASGASSPLVSPRWRTHSRSSSVSSFGAGSVGSVGITETLKADVNSLWLRLAEAERELVSCYTQSQIYKKELVALRQRLGMRVDDLYVDDPVPSSIRVAAGDGSARPRRSQSVSGGASSSGSTPSQPRRGSVTQHEYFTLPAGGTGVLGATPRRISQRPRSVLLSPRRSMDDHHIGGGEATSFFTTKTGKAQRRTVK
ncbi:hypothetical protein H4R24_005193 [Coemansia sp. RSA 988]|nr:hypothetical protein H4R24_005193 [Coemansia sp. RSA 988]